MFRLDKVRHAAPQFCAGAVVGYYLPDAGCRMLKTDQAPALGQGSIYAYIGRIVKQVQRRVVHAWRLRRVADAQQAFFDAELAGKQAQVQPPFVPFAVHTKISIWFVAGKSSEAVQRQVKAFARLVFIGIEHDESIVEFRLAGP
jgi:hypothetical protein